MSEDDLYDLAPQDPKPVMPLPSTPGSAAPTPLSYQTPAAQRKQEKPAADPIIDFKMPVILLTAGVIIQSLAALITSRGRPNLLSHLLLDLGVHLVLGTAIMLAGLWIAARFRGIEFGDFWTATLKLAAIAVAPGAVVTLISPALHVIPLGFLLAAVGQFILYFALLGALFKMDQSDTWYCVCVIFVLSVGVYFLVKLVV